MAMLPGIVLFRINAGGPLVTASDGGPDWLGDTRAANSPFLVDPGSNRTTIYQSGTISPGSTVEASVPSEIFDSQRFDANGGTNQQYAFDVPAVGDYEVRLYLGNGFTNTSEPGLRIFDVALEDSVPNSLDNVDPTARFGHRVGGVISNVVTVEDGTLNIEFLHGIRNPLVNGIEIVRLDGSAQTNPIASIAATQDAAEPDSDGQFAVSLSEAAATDTAIAYSVSGMATPGEDYAALSGTVVIPAGQIFATLDVEVLDDTDFEGSESVIVTLAAVTTGDANVVIGAEDTATVTIADDEVASSDPNNPILFRVNAGGPQIAATDSGPDWLGDTRAANSPFLVDPGSNRTTIYQSGTISPGSTVEASVPSEIFGSQRFDANGGTNQQYAFDVPAVGDYEVRLYLANGFANSSEPGQRVFDVALEGAIPSSLDNVDLSDRFGHRVGGVISNEVTVTDGTLNIEFLHGIRNPLVNGIEIVSLDEDDTSQAGSTIQLVTNNISVNENAGEVLIGLERVGSSDGVASVDFSTASNSAVDGEDFLGSSQLGTIQFADGETEQSIRIPIVDDSLVEGPETFNVLTGEPTGATLGFPRTVTVTINDNDVSSQSVVNFSQADFSVNEAAGEAVVTITRQGGLQSEASVDFTTIDNYAQSSGDFPDFVPVTQTVNFAPGQASRTVTIPILNDDLPETGDSFNLSLSNPNGLELGVRSTASLSIEDNGQDDAFLAGFSQELVVGEGLQGATDFAWLSDHQILIAQQDGIIHLYDTETGELTEFLDFTDRVNIDIQRGLLGLAVHPDFENNPYVYLGYAYDPPGVVPDQNGPRDSRLVRVEVDASTGFTTAIPDSEVVLVTVPDSNSGHSTGGLRFGTDGSLFWTHGDGAGVASLPQLRPEDFGLDNPLGKLYRVDPITGEGLPDNPYYTGNPNDLASRIYSQGLRSPFRIAVNPETNEPFIGDVGSGSYEEINTGRGANFGWPFFEGGQVNGRGVSLPQPTFSLDPGLQDFFDSNPDVTAPIYSRNHDENRFAIVLGDFLDTDNYPEIYRDALVVADTSRTFGLEALLFDDEGDIAGSVDLPFDIPDDQLPTSLQIGPDGNLYFTTFSRNFIGSSELYRLTFDADLLPTDPLSQDQDAILYRVNAGGPFIPANDGGPNWLPDTLDNNSDFLLDPGSNRTTRYQPGTIAPGQTIDASVPNAIFDSQRFDAIGGSNLQYAFDVPAAGDYEVRLYLGNGFVNSSEPGLRIFDVALEGNVPSSLDNVDLTEQFGHRVGGVISNVVTVDDGTLNIEFLHGIRNPLVNGIEVVQIV